MKKLLIFIITVIFNVGFSKTVKYELNVTKQQMNLSGKKIVDFALTVNGGIPAPTLDFTEGDEAEITVKNNIASHEELSIHWHGILLPPQEDGVPYVNSPPILYGETYTFHFKLRQHGTYWYHSHTMTQEQKGVYGAIIIHPKKETIAYDKDLAVVLSDWSDENGDQIIQNLKKDGDYYRYKKNTIRSYFGALQTNFEALKNMISNEWTRMGGMDFSDVGYDAFLINGKKNSQLIKSYKGEKIRIRIINAAASSYFRVALGNLPMNVISSDGIDIQPILAKEILIGMAETYDILFTLPDNKNYELRATCQDITGYASTWIGHGIQEKAVDIAMPDLYSSMSHNHHHMGNMDMSSGDQSSSQTLNHQNHEAMADMHSHQHATLKKEHADHIKAKTHQTVVQTLTVDALRAQVPTTFSKDIKIHDFKLVLDGDMERYIWHINGKVIQEDRILEIQENEIIRFTFVNQTMMHHPMHLHGHFFRVVNQNNEYSPLKHTVDVSPNSTKVIEFYSNEPGQWMLHCHNLYHMMTGMARVVKYANWEPTFEMKHIEHQDHHNHDNWYFSGELELATNHLESNLKFSQTWNEIDFRFEASNLLKNPTKNWEYESDIFYVRWFNNWMNVILGTTLDNSKIHAVIGFGYTLPLLIKAQALLNHEGNFRLDLNKTFQWTSNILSDVNYMGRSYFQQKSWSHDLKLSLMYALDWNWSGGLILKNKSIGAGINMKF